MNAKQPAKVSKFKIEDIHVGSIMHEVIGKYSPKTTVVHLHYSIFEVHFELFRGTWVAVVVYALGQHVRGGAANLELDFLAAAIEKCKTAIRHS